MINAKYGGQLALRRDVGELWQPSRIALHEQEQQRNLSVVPAFQSDDECHPFMLETTLHRSQDMLCTPSVKPR